MIEPGRSTTYYDVAVTLSAVRAAGFEDVPFGGPGDAHSAREPTAATRFRPAKSGGFPLARFQRPG
ncbi:MAG: hypothetical protein AAF628_28595 [Planctomycetota bacterium]